MSLMSFPGKTAAPAKRSRCTTSDAGKPLGVVDAWAKENGDIALSAGNYDTTNAYMILSIDVPAAEQLVKRLQAAITNAAKTKT